MAAAARTTDTSTHGGTIIGPGVATVLIGGLPAAVMGDTHQCSLPANTHQPTISTFAAGSTSVLINNRAALRTTDTCTCGAGAAVGEVTVQIG